MRLLQNLKNLFTSHLHDQIGALEEQLDGLQFVLECTQSAASRDQRKITELIEANHALFSNSCRQLQEIEGLSEIVRDQEARIQKVLSQGIYAGCALEAVSQIRCGILRVEIPAIRCHMAVTEGLIENFSGEMAEYWAEAQAKEAYKAMKKASKEAITAAINSFKD